jgi:heat-inducible transcriptional repressor
VATNGRVENRVVEVDFDVDRQRLERIHNYLEELLSGLTLDEMRERVLRELGADKNRYDQLVSAALRLGKAALEQPPKGTGVIVSGQANLLDAARPGDDDQLTRMRNLLQTLEDKEMVVRLLDKAMTTPGIRVFLGAETAHAALDESSVVVTPYGPEDRAIGAIAVVGPMRMNYGKVMSIVDFTADLVSRLATGDLDR